MSNSVVKELVSKGESQQVEFKLGAMTPESAAEVVCAFLNTRGGTLLVGVSDDGRITGVVDASARAHAIEKALNDQISPLALWSVAVERPEEGDVIVVTVPPGPSRPYVCRDAIYVRRGGQTERTHPAAASEIRSLISDQASQPTRWERLPAIGLDLADLDQSQISRTVEEASRDRFLAFRDPSDTGAVLSELGLAEFGRVTNAGQVLFAKNPAASLPQTRVRASLFTTDEGGDFVDNRVFEGNTFALLDALDAFAKLHVPISARFGGQDLRREDRPAYPFAALREGLINALAHRDYAYYAGGMSVGVYPDRIEIWNSGNLPKGLKLGDLKKAHPSLPPNPDIAHVLYLRRLIERVGRGTLKIVDECKAAGLPEPRWTQNATGVTLTIYGRRRRPGQGLASVSGLNERQVNLLASMKPGEAITPGEYHERIAGTSARRTARRDLSQLEAGGWLRREGHTRSVAYIRTEEALP